MSVDGLNSVAQTAYEMTIAGVKNQIGPTDIKELTSASVAEAMISKFALMHRLLKLLVIASPQKGRGSSTFKVDICCNH